MKLKDKFFKMLYNMGNLMKHLIPISKKQSDEYNK